MGQRIVVYGVGGIGKTCLAAMAPDALFLDTEGGAYAQQVQCVEGVHDWASLRDALHYDNLWAGYKTIVIDTATKAQEWAETWTLQNVKHEKGHTCNRIEDYGFGKGYRHLFDTFKHLLADLDRHVLAGRHVILVAHSSVETAVNPFGDDFKQYQPALSNPPKEGRIRDLVKNWCDHLLFVGYDLSVNKDGKAVGSGTRTIYTSELPTHWAKSRTLPPEPIVYDRGSSDVWNMIFGGTHAPA